ncbi:MAG: two-component regulator propeller domain-containing protein, partial [Calditrichaceae bacterium]
APYTNEGFISLNKNDWIYINQSIFPGIGDGEISCIGFDDFYQAYIGTFRNGLYIIDYQNPGSVNYVKKLTTKDNLYDNNIITVKKDQDGIIWIGTASGLNSYDGINLYRHPGDVNGLSGPLGNQINQIFVDEANNKWFATSGGLSILRGGRSPWDSTAWIGFTKENSGLVGNMVNTVFVDPDNSEALIGTESGLSIYRGDFAEIRQEYDKMAAGPNPFIIGKATNKFIIKNLIYNSEVKIFTLNGQLVRVLNANTGNVR